MYAPWMPQYYNVIYGRKNSNPPLSKRQKKKAPMVEEGPEVEEVTKTEYIYEDTQCVSGVEPEYKWGEVYRLISHRRFPTWASKKNPSMLT